MLTTHPTHHTPWNKGKLIGQKTPLKLKEIWSICVRLIIVNRYRESEGEPPRKRAFVNFGAQAAEYLKVLRNQAGFKRLSYASYVCIVFRHGPLLNIINLFTQFSLETGSN